MTSPRPAHDLVVIQLSGGNDYLNTLVPYADGLYYDHRPTIGLRPDDVLPLTFQNRDRADPQQPSVVPLDARVGLHGGLAPFARLHAEGRLAVLMGIGYPDHNRSHFRSMDIWHTGVPETYSNVGWLGKTAAILDPDHQNPVLVVNLGKAAPLAVAHPGVLAASLDSLATYGIFPDMAGDTVRHEAFAGAVRGLYEASDLPHAWQQAGLVGRSALLGIDRLRASASGASPAVEYPRFNPLAEHLRTIATIKAARLGTRIFYATHGGYDTHNDQLVTQQRLLEQLASAVTAFLSDLESRGLADDTVILIFSEFGRRIAENRGGTDHGAAGVAFLIGPHVQGGLYGEYVSLRPEDQIDGDVRPSIDFREVYSAILGQFMHIDPQHVFGRASRALPLGKVA